MEGRAWEVVPSVEGHTWEVIHCTRTCMKCRAASTANGCRYMGCQLLEQLLERLQLLSVI